MNDTLKAIANFINRCDMEDVIMLAISSIFLLPLLVLAVFAIKG